uniref:G patch domain and ankyrin repeat-containing protein 1 n=1 Tax=Dicentrarchus labrax TaxID=13489 RepID=A0A8P4G1L7_DICLA
MAGLGFTPASGQDIFSIETTEQPSSATSSALSGREARQFYEHLMKDEDHGREHQNKQRRRARAAERQRGQTDSVLQSGTRGGSDGNQRRETSNSERTTELLGLRLLRCAHNGDISGLKDLLSKGVDINFQDTYFWTAVMCASWSGQRDAVRLLLQHGAAWVGVVDTQGRDAKDLALEAGHNEVLEELESYGRSPERDTPSGSRVTSLSSSLEQRRTSSSGPNVTHSTAENETRELFRP